MSLRVLLLIGFSALALFALAADHPPPEVELELADGSKVNGTLQTPTLRVKTAYGITELDIHHVQRLTISPGEEKGHDVVEFTDGEHLRGEVVTESLTLKVGEAVQTHSRASIREMKATKEQQLGAVALLLGLVTLAAMEIVLGVDNIIFLAIVAGKLPPAQQPKARRIGLILALGTRILLLLSLTWLLGLTKPVLTLPDLPYFHDLEAREVSTRDLILLAGGMFLIYKSVAEMHEKLEAARGGHDGKAKPVRTATFGAVLVQIAILDIVFSLDSVITAVGMVDQVWVMIVAMVIAMGVMLVFAGSISNFVDKHPTIKILALAFLILIGVMLVAESLGQHINKGYIYFAMAFGVGIEMLNIRLRGHGRPVVNAVKS